MLIKNIIDEDFVNYNKPSMFIIFPTCTWKCEKECGITCCQNSKLSQLPNIEVSAHNIAKRYKKNPITKAIVCGGLEPFDSWEDLQNLIIELRALTQDDIVIYTGYRYSEICQQVDKLRGFSNIIIKFERFIPGQKPHYDEILGVNLASDNQYAERIS